MFGRPIEDPHQMSFAFGETLAHVNYLVRKQVLAIRSNKDGAWTIVPASASVGASDGAS
jgi:hypothetical protein